MVSTPSGKGCLPETHPLALGVFGTFGTSAANACVAEADLVIVAGSKMTASDTARENPALLDPERQTFVQIDVEPRNLSWTFAVEHALLGEAGIILEQLRNALRQCRVKLGSVESRPTASSMATSWSMLPGRMRRRWRLSGSSQNCSAPCRRQVS